MNIENEHSFVAALRQGINLFLGAGFSVLASDKQGKPLPAGNSLGSVSNFGQGTEFSLTNAAFNSAATVSNKS